MGRYLRLFLIQLKASALQSVQYRVEFFVEAIMALFWMVAALIPLLVLYGQRNSVAGWTWPETLLVVAWFTCLKGLLDGAIQPSLVAVVEHVRKGTLDFVLLKPADAQFLVSTTKFDLTKSVDVLGGLFLVVYALRELHHVPTLGALLATAGLLLGAVLILYSIWILTVALAFIVVKVDNLTYLFSSLFEAARWPSSVYRGALAFIFTFIIPLAVITTYPALALLGRLDLRAGGFALAAAVVFLTLSRLAWRGALKRYTSAGG